MSVRGEQKAFHRGSNRHFYGKFLILNRFMFELETVLAFSVGAGLVAIAPIVSKFGNQQLGDAMSHSGKKMAKEGIKLGVTIIDVAGTATKSFTRRAAEAVESIGDLVAEARTELESEAAVTSSERESDLNNSLETKLSKINKDSDGSAT